MREIRRPVSVDYAIMAGMPPHTGPLVGREVELERLHELIGLGTSSGAQPGGVVLSGDAGIGKSRLIAHLVSAAGSAGWLTGVGHCVGQAGSAIAYLPFVELVGSINAQRPDVVDPVLAGHPRLVHLLPGHPEARASSLTTGSTGPGEVAEAVHALLTALGNERPALIVIEDVHWADRSSRDLLTLLLTRGFGTPVIMVVSYRTDDLHRRHPLHETLAVWARIAGLEHLELGGLPDRAVRTLVADLQGSPTDRVTTDEIVRRSAGNPFFVEELVASGSAGSMASMVSIGPTASAGSGLSGGLTRVLRARVEQLDDTTQSMLRAMSLKGSRAIGHELLSRVADLPDETLEAAIAAAVEHHVVEALWPPAYTFRHALLGETVADSLLPGERLRLHRSYAAVLTEHPGLGSNSELARHAAAVGDLTTAVRASRAAGEAAMSIGGPQEALLHFEQALSWLSEDDPERDAMTLRASDAATVAGEPVRAIGLLRDRLDHPGVHQRPEVRADLLASLVVLSRSVDLPVDSQALLDEAFRLIGDTVDERRVRVLVAQLQTLVDSGSFVEAAVVENEVSLVAERLGLTGTLAEVRTILARMLEAKDDLGSVKAHLARVIADLDPDDPLLLRALHQRASISHRAGDLADALADYDAGAVDAARMHRAWAPWGQESRLLAGLTAYELGDWDGAEQRLDLGDRPAPEPGRSIFVAASLLVRAGRGRPVDSGVFDDLREWWPVDSLGVVLTVMPGIDLLGDDGQPEAALLLAESAVSALDRTWGAGYHAIVRLAALMAGQAASAAPQADAKLRHRMVTFVESLVTRARTTAHVESLHVAFADLHHEVDGGTRADAAAAPDASDGGDGGDVDHQAATEGLDDRSRELMSLEKSSTETWAWLARLEAEVLRLRHVTDLEHPPSASEVVDAWRHSVAAFERYGHCFETARSRARLAAALKAAGDDAAAALEAAQAREVAVRLGAQPLMVELARLAPPSTPSDTLQLTPREGEVLALVARGLTNGQIGRQLFISTKTVSVHVSNLLAKLGAAGRTEAVALARERGLLP